MYARAMRGVWDHIAGLLRAEARMIRDPIRNPTRNWFR